MDILLQGKSIAVLQMLNVQFIRQIHRCLYRYNEPSAVMHAVVQCHQDFSEVLSCRLLVEVVNRRFDRLIVIADGLKGHTDCLN